MTSTRKPSIYPVVLSGGAGTRLWPLSRALYPKQLLPLNSELTMLQETVRRAAGEGFAAPLVICNDEHRFVIAEQLRALEVEPWRIVLEPMGRNTAPAAAAAALMLAEADPEAALLVLPSDHVVRDLGRFRAAVEAGLAAARAGKLVTFGVPAASPETSYGYIRRGAALDGLEGCYAVARFVEKPDRGAAQDYLAEGGYDWNSGMFMFLAARYLEELERLKPELLAACRKAVANAVTDLDFLRLDGEAFAAAESISIDYAVMEHTREAAVVPVEMGWSDVGSWSALWELGEKDAQGNVLLGDAIAYETRGSYVRADGKLAAVVGVEDVVVVVSDDAVLVTSRDRAQDVKTVVDLLRAQGRSEHLSHAKVYRPWGYYQSVDAGDRFQVKHLSVKPGAKLSLQLHHRRAEHWVVVSGTATVRRGDESFVLHENESTYIPVGVKHSLENAGNVPLRVIEVQSGAYLGEDDIVRFEDLYGRGPVEGSR
jgi:mannose-1-phosphate guanylyltransferase/mannose-1-phosphate guanylyltransferase/mannose-6-phosphate isomerase